MTIRLRCAACQRKLKVPDEALGKKVQCPTCGARFVGQIEPESPAPQPLTDAPATQLETETPLPPLEQAAEPRASAPEAPPADLPIGETILLHPDEDAAPTLDRDEEPVVDLLFTELSSHPLEDVAVPPPHKSADPVTPFLRHAPEEPSAEPDPLRELEEPHGLDDLSASEPIMLGGAEEADPFVSADEEPVDLVDEVDEEEDEPIRGKKVKKRERSGQRLVVVLVGVLCALLLGCGGVGYLVYRFVLGD